MKTIFFLSWWKSYRFHHWYVNPYSSQVTISLWRTESIWCHAWHYMVSQIYVNIASDDGSINDDFSLMRPNQISIEFSPGCNHDQACFSPMAELGERMREGVKYAMSMAVTLLCQRKETGPHLNIKTIFPRYGDSHVKDKTVARPSYL